MSSTCKAEIRSDCRFHGRKAYARTLLQIADTLKVSKKADTFEQKEYWDARTRKFEVSRDATAIGFKKLSKELRKTLKAGTVEEQNAIVARISAAAELRLLDGYRSEWADCYSDLFTFGSRIIELSRTNETVRVPAALLGTQTVGIIADRLQREGFTVTSFTVVDFTSNRGLSDERLAEIQAGTLDYFKTFGGEDIWDYINEKNCALRGLMFKDESGKETVVLGDIDIDTENNDKNGY